MWLLLGFEKFESVESGVPWNCDDDITFVFEFVSGAFFYLCVCGFFWWYVLLASAASDRYMRLLVFVSATSHGILSTNVPFLSMTIHSFSKSTLRLSFRHSLCLASSFVSPSDFSSYVGSVGEKIIIIMIIIKKLIIILTTIITIRNNDKHNNNNNNIDNNNNNKNSNNYKVNKNNGNHNKNNNNN